MADAVTECIRALIERGMTRLDQLEVLLCLATAPERVWGVVAVADDVHLDSKRATEALAGLARAGLVVQTLGEPDDGHRLDRTRVVNAFYACNLDSLRNYARSRFQRSG
jgi:DNA-binding MarR family transcriptional regulator